MLEKKHSQDNHESWGPGIENTRILPMNHEPRMKRTAVSAQPLSTLAGTQGELIKIPKNSV